MAALPDAQVALEPQGGHDRGGCAHVARDFHVLGANAIRRLEVAYHFAQPLLLAKVLGACKAGASLSVELGALGQIAAHLGQGASLSAMVRQNPETAGPQPWKIMVARIVVCDPNKPLRFGDLAAAVWQHERGEKGLTNKLGVVQRSRHF